MSQSVYDSGIMFVW